MDTTIPIQKDHFITDTLSEPKSMEKKILNYVKRTEEIYKEKKSTPVSIIWGQCSDTMMTNIKALDVYYKDLSECSDRLELMKEIKVIFNGFESQDNLYMPMDDAKASFYTNKHGQVESSSDYLTKFKIMHQDIQHYEGSLCADDTSMASPARKRYKPIKHMKGIAKNK